METNDADKILLDSLEQKLQVIRDRIQGVAEDYQSGFYLYGEGGTSKSFTVEETLKQLKKPYKLTNSHLSGKGLFRALKTFPDVVHVLEDAETLFRDKKSFGVLRSALWGQTNAAGKQERVVCWQTADLREEFVFTGGVIIVANRALDDIPELRAVKSRVPSLQYQPTNDEVAALMRSIARKGHRHGTEGLTPEECLEVVAEIIERACRLKRNLDLRLMVNTFQDRLQYQNGAAETHWRDLLESRMKERTIEGPKTGIRATKKEQELAVVRQIRDLPPEERLAIWMKETEKSRPALYRRLNELKATESQSSQKNRDGDNGETGVTAPSF